MSRRVLLVKPARTRTNTIPNGTKANAAGLSGLRAIAQKAKNGRRGGRGRWWGRTYVEKCQRNMPVWGVNNGKVSGACFQLSSGAQPKRNSGPKY